MDLKKKKHLTLILLLVVMLSGVGMYGVAVSAAFSNDVRVACVGDSITASSGYTQKLQELLGKDYLVANFGVTGSTISHSSRLPYVNQPQFHMAQDFNPDVVLIMLGTNDANRELTYSYASLEADYNNIVTAFQNLSSHPQVFVVKSPPIFTSPGSAYDNTNLANKVNPRVENLAAQMSLPTIDMYAVFGNHTDYFADGVHPNDEGANLIAATMCQTIFFYEPN